MSLASFIRETPFGQLVHAVSRGQLLRHPEEERFFLLPGHITTPPSLEPVDDAATMVDRLVPGVQTHQTFDEKGSKVVTWYGEDDADNPQNWSPFKKLFVSCVLSLFTFSVYVGSAILTSGYDSLANDFGVSDQVLTLTLTMYVLAYGVGALVLSPLSEIPALGRNPFYWAPMILFVAFQAGASRTPTFAGLVVLRFLTGFVGSPVLATGGASLADIYSTADLPVMLCFWVVPAFFSPAIGPVISSFAIVANGWRWSMYELLWLSGFCTLLLIFALPETSSQNILHRRAQRLRSLTGDASYTTQFELDNMGTSTLKHIQTAIFRPFLITVLDPSIAFANLYTSLVYSFYYCFFDAFPIAFREIRGWSITGEGLAYLSVAAGALVGFTGHICYHLGYLRPYIKRYGFPVHEKRLQPALVSAVSTPIGLLIFAWTSRADVHWIASMIGVVVFVGSNFITLQCLFFYIIISYEQYGASLLAANDFIRSVVAVGFLHAGLPLFHNLGVGRGVSVLAGLSCLGVPGMLLLLRYGAYLRSRSRFTS